MSAFTRFSLALLMLGPMPALLSEAEASQNQEPKKSEIRGTVVRASDRQPVNGAKVSLDGTEHTLVTDLKAKPVSEEWLAAWTMLKARKPPVDTTPAPGTMTPAS